MTGFVIEVPQNQQTGNWHFKRVTSFIRILCSYSFVKFTTSFRFSSNSLAVFSYRYSKSFLRENTRRLLTKTDGKLDKMKVDTCYRKVILIKNRSLIDHGLKLLHSNCTLTSLANLFLSAACCPTLQTNFFSFSTLNPISEQLKYKFISYKTRIRLPGDFRMLENNTAPLSK